MNRKTQIVLTMQIHNMLNSKIKFKILKLTLLMKITLIMKITIFIKITLLITKTLLMRITLLMIINQRKN